MKMGNEYELLEVPKEKKIEFICRNKKSSMSPKHEKVRYYFSAIKSAKIFEGGYLGCRCRYSDTVISHIARGTAN